MGENVILRKYDNASQRVASTCLRMLAQFSPILPDGLTQEQQAETVASQADLHAFFHALYEAIYAAPDQFGLPLAEDAFYLVEHSKEGPNKADIKRILDRPRKLIGDGMDFLSAFGKTGRLESLNLVLDPGNPALVFLKKKPGRAWLNGMATVGLKFTQADGVVILANTKFPKMMPALKALAESCWGCKNESTGKIFFARCDFRALKQDFSIDALDLYRIFKPEDYARVAELHTYFTSRSYRALVQIYHLFQWEVKYQGNKSIKATPLFQVEFDERYVRQIRAQIKCASAGRVAPFVPAQSQELQDDFARRSNPCGNCHWCDKQKALGPAEYTYRGEERKICWYVNPDIQELTDETVHLVQEYAQLHESIK